MKRQMAVVLTAVVLVLAGCSSSDDGDRAEERDATTTVPGRSGDVSVPPPPTEPIDEDDLAAAEDEVAGLGLLEAQPPAVVECVTGAVATDDDLAEAVAAVDEADPDTLEPVAAEVARCAQDVVLAPEFAAEQQRAAGGSLSDTELACLRDGYADLTPEQVEAATGAALNPEAAPDDAMEPVEEILDRCGVER